MRVIDTPAYRKAFDDYLRRGTPIDLSLKADDGSHPTAQYIWRTQGDGRVRALHRANDGKVFSWDDPPPTGHPGEDYGCRCRAEPYYPPVREYASQTLTSIVDDNLTPWRSLDFILHFYLGGGQTVELFQTGHFRQIVNRVEAVKFKAFARQIAKAARAAGEGPFSTDFENVMPFIGISFSYGNSTVSGQFEGIASIEAGHILVEGIIGYEFRDKFTDPLDVEERIGRDPEAASLIPDLLEENPDIGGRAYDISANWAMMFSGVFRRDPSGSEYV